MASRLKDPAKMYTNRRADKGGVAVSVREARQRFAELLNRAEYGSEQIVITRHGKPIARLVGASAA